MQGTNTDIPTPIASQSITMRTPSGCRSSSLGIGFITHIQFKIDLDHIDRRQA